MKLFAFERKLHDLIQEQVDKGGEVVCKTEQGICRVICSNGTTIIGDYCTCEIIVNSH